MLPSTNSNLQDAYKMIPNPYINQEVAGNLLSGEAFDRENHLNQLNTEYQINNCKKLNREITVYPVRPQEEQHSKQRQLDELVLQPKILANSEGVSYLTHKSNPISTTSYGIMSSPMPTTVTAAPGIHNKKTDHPHSIPSLLAFKELEILKQTLSRSTWHPHVYARPPQRPTPHSIADILGWHKRTAAASEFSEESNSNSSMTISLPPTTTTQTPPIGLEQILANGQQKLSPALHANSPSHITSHHPYSNQLPAHEHRTTTPHIEHFKGSNETNDEASVSEQPLNLCVAKKVEVLDDLETNSLENPNITTKTLTTKQLMRGRGE